MSLVVSRNPDNGLSNMKRFSLLLSLLVLSLASCTAHGQHWLPWNAKLEGTKWETTVNAMSDVKRLPPVAEPAPIPTSPQPIVAPQVISPVAPQPLLADVVRDAIREATADQPAASAAEPDAHHWLTTIASIAILALCSWLGLSPALTAVIRKATESVLDKTLNNLERNTATTEKIATKLDVK